MDLGTGGDGGVIVLGIAGRCQLCAGLEREDGSGGERDFFAADALTTTRPRPERATITTNRMVIEAVLPATRPISVRAISAREWPLWRTLAARTSISCMAPARQTPITIQIKPGR